MGPKTPVPQGDFFRQPLREQINLKHPLIGLADLIDWDRLSTAMSASFVSPRGRPATSPRLIAGLLYLQHAFNLSDEEVVWQWLENPYWQVFTGETFLQTQPPIDPSSLTRWRKRLGEAGVEELLAETIEAAKRGNVIKTSSLKRVIVDTTVMEKAFAHPTDSRLLERCREHLVKAAARHGLKLRQNYNREAPRLAGRIGRYAHAKQYKRMKKALRTLRSRCTRCMSDRGDWLAEAFFRAVFDGDYEYCGPWDEVRRRHGCFKVANAYEWARGTNEIIGILNTLPRPCSRVELIEAFGL